MCINDTELQWSIEGTKTSQTEVIWINALHFKETKSSVKWFYLPFIYEITRTSVFQFVESFGGTQASSIPDILSCTSAIVISVISKTRMEVTKVTDYNKIVIENEWNAFFRLWWHMWSVYLDFIEIPRTVARTS